MATSRATLSEFDVPGASLQGRDPGLLKVPELKRWLECRAASTKGRKVDLIARVRAYIENGWSGNVVDPDKKYHETRLGTSSQAANGQISTTWKDIKTAYTSQALQVQFTNAQIVEYFVTRTVSDGRLSADFKSINKSALNLFRCGHVQNIEISSDETNLHMRANCLPEMRKDRVYKLLLTMKRTTLDVISAQCGCPGGKGPHATCKHIAALCYGFQNFCEHQSMPDYLTCTQQLQQWNKPRQKRVEPIPVTSIKKYQNSINNPRAPKRPRTPSNFDPRPLEYRHPSNTNELEKLRTDLLHLGRPCALLSVLVPDVDKAMHDHSYCKPGGGVINEVNSCFVQVRDLSPYSSEELKVLCDQVKKELFCTQKERIEIEKNTRKQSDCALWYEVRYKRITGSKCSQILKQVSRTPALLRNILYMKRLTNPVPAPIKWGRDHENIARLKYIEFMNADGHDVTVEHCGFFVHPHESWLGASPDGVVKDPCCNPSNGLLEIKCPYSKREISPKVACADSSFYCSLSNSGMVKLKRSHGYYHQVQLQLFACSDLCQWCDFCVYTPVGITVERITLDEEWATKSIPILKDYYDNVILPELVYPIYKPSYFL